MNAENIVLPSGLLRSWEGISPSATADDGSATDETFDVTQVASRRARALSVSIGGIAEAREAGIKSLASAIPIRGTSEVITKEEVDVDPRHAAPVQSRPKRATTINLGDLGRSKVTGLPTPAKPGLRLYPSTLASIPELSNQPVSRPTAVTDQVMENSFIFQSLDDYHVPGDKIQSQNPSVFLARNSESNGVSIDRTNSGRRPSLARTPSNSSKFSAADIMRRASIALDNVVDTVFGPAANAVRRSTLADIYEKAKVRQVKLMRSPAAQYVFEYTFYVLIAATVYFVLVGIPLWKGLIWYIYIVFAQKLLLPVGTAVFLGVAFLYAYLPLLISFEKDAPRLPEFPPHPAVRRSSGKNIDTALLIPCYKSESLIAATLEAALKVFPATSIFVIANGNSATPLDDTASVCERYGVSHTWSPLGSKIIAQFVGCFVAKKFPYVLLIDDDCLLPPNFPIVTERLRGAVQCIGYTIKSVGPNRSRGTLCQQAQDVEYKLSGLQRAFAGKIGSATFPHGAISIWDRELLIKTFQEHPGFSVSEDWFFGHVARQLGCRIKMCTSVFVETETPSAIFFSGGGARGGFGEMTIWKQRFFRWNFFFVNGMYYDMCYILFDWKLGWWELGAKLFVFQEVYETLLYLLAPFVLPISFVVRPSFSGYLFIATIVLYFVNVIIFNYVHLRSRNQMVTMTCLLYYVPYKLILTFVNVASCYYSIYKYAKYFAKRHPKVIEDEKALAIVLRLEEEQEEKLLGDPDKTSLLKIGSGPGSVQGRRMTITAVGTNLNSVLNDPQPELGGKGIDIVDFGAVDFGEKPTVPPPDPRFNHHDLSPSDVSPGTEAQLHSPPHSNSLNRNQSHGSGRKFSWQTTSTVSPPRVHRSQSSLSYGFPAPPGAESCDLERSSPSPSGRSSPAQPIRRVVSLHRAPSTRSTKSGMAPINSASGIPREPSPVAQQWPPYRLDIAQTPTDTNVPNGSEQKITHERTRISQYLPSTGRASPAHSTRGYPWNLGRRSPSPSPSTTGRYSPSSSTMYGLSRTSLRSQGTQTSERRSFDTIQEMVVDVNDLNRRAPTIEEIVAGLPDVIRWTSHGSRRRTRRDRFMILEDEDEEHWLDQARGTQSRALAIAGSGSERVVIKEDSD